MNNVKIGSSSKNNKHLNANKSVNRFRRTTLRIPTMTSKMSYFLCRKKDHYIWECKFSKNKKDEDENASEAIFIKDIIAIVSDVCNNMIIVIYMVIITNPSDWWFDSGTILHMCNYNAYFKTYEESFIELEVLVGIHSKAKLHGKCIVKVKLSFGKKFSWPMFFMYLISQFVI